MGLGLGLDSEAGFAGFGEADAAFGEFKGAEAGDDLKEGAKFAGAGVGAGGEFEEAELELLFAGVDEGGFGVAEGGWVEARRIKVFEALGFGVGDVVGGVEAAEGAGADNETEAAFGDGAGGEFFGFGVGVVLDPGEELFALGFGELVCDFDFRHRRLKDEG